MSKRSPRWVWLDDVKNAVRAGTLTPRAGHVGSMLAVHYVNGHQEAWPSQRELAAVTGLSVRTVQRALSELEEQGLLEHRHGLPAHSFGNVYRLLTTSQ